MMELKDKKIIRMVHLAGYNDSIIIARALDEINIYESEGVYGCIIENYHSNTDFIFRVLDELEKQPKKNIKIGVNVLPNDYVTAFMIADIYKLDFIQLDYVAGKYKSNHSINPMVYNKLRAKYPNVVVLGGVWPKYYTPVNDSVLEDDLKEAMTRCDAIVVTGEGTGKETPLDKIKTFRNIIGNFPLIVGAGLNKDNAIEQLNIADGAIVGSAFKPYNRTNEMVMAEFVKELMDKISNK